MKLNPLHNQVGGHDGVLSMGEENEIIVKPALLQELKFYEEAFLHPELQAWMPAYYGTLTLNRQLPENGLAGEVALVPTIKALSGFAIQDLLSSDQIPSAAAFSGEGQEQEQTVIKEDGNDECICLENISHGFKKPCVLDLKMGTQLYDDDATDEKKARLGAVANNTTTSTLGLRLTGFTVCPRSLLLSTAC
ncbi:hypothetical protein BC939DRAFT_451576 [Gamsiella multidivaricata]|uniref:uncharacterized protein n=1 Tax=Gamsiella multidivaricata TaxID=101098 RepID=UPI0022206727|nr:uncharacterized protein BC939DRAFT_451576 [Gamsiella multidivaricata]KAI7823274.1 hypothetical protein BC939DRAFT_451576 [Gamsiella multidivaricata]